MTRKERKPKRFHEKNPKVKSEKPCKGLLKENPRRGKLKDNQYHGDINFGYLVGTLGCRFEFIQCINGKNLVKTKISVPRKGGKNIDVIPVVLTENLYKSYDPRQEVVVLKGSFQLKQFIDQDRECKLYDCFMPQEISFDIENYTQRQNSIHLAGTVINDPIIKPRKESNLIYFAVEVNTPSKKNFINVYVKEKYADKVTSLAKGDQIDFVGNLQSREILKQDGTDVRVREVCLNRVNVINKACKRQEDNILIVEEN